MNEPMRLDSSHKGPRQASEAPVKILACQFVEDEEVIEIGDFFVEPFHGDVGQVEKIDFVV